MSIKDALKAADDAQGFDLEETREVLNELLIEVEDFITAIEDYDEWQLMPGGDPGFYLTKLRVMLGYDEEGN